jgi:hypothetical protein
VATPNYAYEKRQRELAKKRKKEEKAARKAQTGQGGGEPAEPSAGDTPAVPRTDAA